MPVRERSPTNPFSRSATIAISDPAAFGRTAPVQPARKIQMHTWSKCTELTYHAKIVTLNPYFRLTRKVRSFVFEFRPRNQPESVSDLVGKKGAQKRALNESDPVVVERVTDSHRQIFHSVSCFFLPYSDGAVRCREDVSDSEGGTAVVGITKVGKQF